MTYRHLLASPGFYIQKVDCQERLDLAGYPRQVRTDATGQRLSIRRKAERK
jgi:hypothetical protein